MRRGEQYGLTWDCVDFDRKVLTIARSKHGQTRHVFLNESAIAALRTVQEMKNGEAHVLLNYRGERLMGPREWFEVVVKEAKIDNFTWHSFVTHSRVD